MNTKHVTTADLNEAMMRTATIERVAGPTMIAQLAEFERRSAYEEFGYPTLHRYARGALGLSPHVASRRVGAALAVAVDPGLLDHLANGALSVTSLSMIAPYLGVPGLLEAALHRSKREVADLIAQHRPARAAIRRKSIRRVAVGLKELRVTLSDSVAEKLVRAVAALGATDDAMGFERALEASLCALESLGTAAAVNDSKRHPRKPSRKRKGAARPRREKHDRSRRASGRQVELEQALRQLGFRARVVRSVARIASVSHTDAPFQIALSAALRMLVPRAADIELVSVGEGVPIRGTAASG